VNDTVFKANIDSLRKAAIDTMRLHRIKFINEQLIAKKLTWRAWDNEIAKKSYAEKKKLFYGAKLPNLQGFEYYAGGYFSFIGDNTPKNSAGVTRNFDWRNRHRANNYYMIDSITPNPYYDNDEPYSGWIAPRFQEQTGFTCWAYSSVYSLQSLINLYYNQHIDLDLSEQQVVTCMNLNCIGGHPYAAMTYINDTGIVNESCFPQVMCDSTVPQQPVCSDICDTASEDIRIIDFFSIDANNSSAEFLTKTSLIKNGPLVGTIISWGHSMSLVGYGFVKEGDYIMYGDGGHTGHQFQVPAGSPDIGKPYYIFQQSWGGWLPYGTSYIQVILNLGNSNTDINGYIIPISNMVNESRKVACNDFDGDGYYNWGIGSKPDTCSFCPDEIDCNDADSTMGPYDMFYNCQLLCDSVGYSSSPIIINTDTTWLSDHCLNKDIIVKYGKTLTIKSRVNFVPEAGITVEPTAKLIVDGGILTGGIDHNRWQGIKVQGDYFRPQTQQYQGYVEMKNGACLNDANMGIEAIYQVVSPGDDPHEEILAGGIINVNGASFGNNLIAISFKPYKNRDTTDNIEYDNVSTIRNCYFLNKDQDVLGSLPIFIRLEEVKGVDINGNYFVDNSSDTLNTHCNGIEAYDASFEFENPLTYVAASNTFTNLYYGIKALYTSPNLAPVIDKALFENCYRGIYLSGNNAATIVRNTFTIPSDDYNCYGLYIDNSTGYKAEGNTFYSGVPPGFGDIGLIVNNSGAELNMVYNNYFASLNYALLAQNDNRGDDDDRYTGLKIKCNDFSGCLNDISVTTDNPFVPGGISFWQGYNEFVTSPASNNFTIRSGTSFEDYNNGCLHFTYYYNTDTTYMSSTKLKPIYYTASSITLDSTEWRYKKSISCPSTLTEEDYGELFVYMVSSNTELNNTARQLQQLVDGGNTPALNTQVELSPPSQALLLRNNLLSKSPFLSDSVLISSIINEDALTPLMLKQVLVANPQTPKSMEIMDTLYSRVHPLPEYMITEIEGVKNIIGDKEKLEARLAYYYQEKELCFNEIIRRYKNDTIHSWAKDSIKSMLDRKNTPWAKYQLVFDKINDKKPSEASQLLNNIPLELNLSEYQLNNYYNYKDYMELAMQLKKDSCGKYILNNSQKQLLNDLVEVSFNYTNAYARNLLILADSLQFNEPIILPHEQPGKIKKPLKKEIINSNVLKVFPNPAQNYFTVEYKLSETAGFAQIEVLDVTGKRLKLYNLFDKQNQIVVETVDLKTGIYYIMLKADGSVTETNKIAIIK